MHVIKLCSIMLRIYVVNKGTTMMKPVIPAVCCLIFSILTGCVQEPDPNMERLISGLGAVNRQLSLANREMNPFAGTAWTAQGIGCGAVEDALLRIKPLPENPGCDEVNTYLKEIAEAVRKGREAESISGRVPAMVRKVGFGHLKELAPYWDTLSIGLVADGVFRKEDAEEALRLLPDYPALYGAVARCEGIDSLLLKEAVFKALRENQRDLGALSVPLLHYVKTPEDIQFMEECFVQNPKAYFVLDKIRWFPQVDAPALGRKAWAEYRNEMMEDRLRLSEILLEFGNMEALEFMMDYGPGGRGARYVAGFFYDPETAAAVSWDKLGEYYRQNRENLQFDGKQRKYIIRNGAE